MADQMCQAPNAANYWTKRYHYPTGKWRRKFRTAAFGRHNATYKRCVVAMKHGRAEANFNLDLGKYGSISTGSGMYLGDEKTSVGEIIGKSQKGLGSDSANVSSFFEMIDKKILIGAVLIGAVYFLR